MIGEERVQECMKAQLRACGTDHGGQACAPSEPICSFPLSGHSGPKMGPGEWSAAATKEVALRTRRTRNHVCKPAVCHKGRLGKMGFCRMFYWHWARGVGAKKTEVAKRMHG
eukprot:3993441-Karenia_brevis.AAC.1